MKNDKQFKELVKNNFLSYNFLTNIMAIFSEIDHSRYLKHLFKQIALKTKILGNILVFLYIKTAIVI